MISFNVIKDSDQLQEQRGIAIISYLRIHELLIINYYYNSFKRHQVDLSTNRQLIQHKIN